MNNALPRHVMLNFVVVVVFVVVVGVVVVVVVFRCIYRVFVESRISVTA